MRSPVQLVRRKRRAAMVTFLVVAVVVLSACDLSPGSQVRRADVDVFDYEKVPFDRVEIPGGLRVGVFEQVEVIFASPSGGLATGRLHKPLAPKPWPGVILLHGSGGHARDMDPVAEILACSGILALAVDAPNAGRGSSFVSFTAEDYKDQVRLIKDLRRSVDSLVDEYGADPNQIGFLGVSYGAAMGSLFIGVDPRVDAAALMVGDGGLVAHFTEDDEPIPEVADVPGIEDWIVRMAPIEPLLFLRDAAPTPVSMVSARRDREVEAEDSMAWHEAAGAGSEVVWVDTGHELDHTVWSDAIMWLGRNLGQQPELLSECATG